MTSPLIPLAKKIATAEGCDPVLIAAMIEQESAWQPWAIRYEPAFMARYVAKLYTTGEVKTATEAYGRAFSWGLLQTLGQVAREHGFDGPLAQLCDPQTGVSVGCRVWLNKLKMAKGDVHQGLLYWNGGSAKEYADQVLARKIRYL